MDNKQITKEQYNEFANKITKLEVIEFIGLAQVLGVKVLNGEEGRNFEEIYPEVVTAYFSLNRKRRRSVDKILKEVIKSQKKQKKIEEKANVD